MKKRYLFIPILLIGIIIYFVPYSHAMIEKEINAIPISLPTHLQVASSITPNELKKVAIDDINAYRTQNGSPPLKDLNSLQVLHTSASDNWANQLLTEHCLHHFGNGGTGPQQRLGSVGDFSFDVGENIAGGQTTVLEDRVQLIKGYNHEMMFNDANHQWSHKMNILNPSFQYISIGIAYDDTNFVIVEDFLTKDPYATVFDPSTYGDDKTLANCWE